LPGGPGPRGEDVNAGNTHQEAKQFLKRHAELEMDIEKLLTGG